MSGRPDSARDLYAARLAARQGQADLCRGRSRILSAARLATFSAGVLLAWLSTISRHVPAASVFLPAILLGLLVVLHRQVAAGQARGERAVRFYQRCLARVEHRWMGTGSSGAHQVPLDHPYAADLDLFGGGSLFQLLATARTRAGEKALAGWLCRPASRVEILARQEAVRELKPRLDLRESMALLGPPGRAEVEPDRLTAWIQADSPLPRGAGPWCRLLTLLLASAFLGWLTGRIPLQLLLVLGLVQVLVGGALRSGTVQVVRKVEQPFRGLAVLAQVMARLEQEQFTSPLLRRLCFSAAGGEGAPSRHVARLGRLLDRLSWRRNQMFAPLAAALMWTTHLALAIDGWRRRMGRQVPAWISALGEMEALLCLTAYAHDHPEDPFPELLETEKPCFDGEGLGHPLLDRNRMVRNHLRLGPGMQLLVVSGSNMSGKSTLLRTVGINVVLALAGAPVCATRLRLSPLALGASICVNDSLQEGRSRFYAEITRLRQIVDLAAGPLPLLFLLDEILHGTNSHDRQKGAAAVIGTLLDRGAVGLVTTHDLALASVAEALGPRAANIHFQDEMVDGKMVFDYRIHPGVVKRSNAIALMRAVGLDVEEAAP
ncbi:MAG: DNA mismatch repair protein MutS [Acidobacteriota bacterium]